MRGSRGRTLSWIADTVFDSPSAKEFHSDPTTPMSCATDAFLCGSVPHLVKSIAQDVSFNFLQQRHGIQSGEYRTHERREI